MDKLSFSADVKDVAAALKRVKPAISSRIVLPVLGCVFVEVDADGVQFTATDMELVLVTDLENVTSGGAGGICLPARQLEKLLSVCEGRVSFAVEGLACTTTNEETTYEITGFAAEDFPQVTGDFPAKYTEIEAAPLREVLRRVLPAASRDETRPILQGVHLEPEGKALKLVTTDSYRLHLASFTPVVKGAKLSPSLATWRLWELVAKSKDDALLYAVGKGRVHVFVDGVYLHMRSVDGQFPNYKRLLPETFERRFTCAVTALGAALAKVCKLSSGKNAPVRLTPDNGFVTVKFLEQDGPKTTSKVPCSGSFEATEEYGFNPDYLRDLVRDVAGGAGEVKIELTTPLRPMVATAEPTNGVSVLGLIMPVRLSA